MLKNYFKVAWRNLGRSKLYSFINITGLATGMAVAMLIGLWIYDEVSFDKKGTDNFDRIGKVWQFVNFGNGIASYDVIPIPLAKDMRANYPDFQRLSLASGPGRTVMACGDKLINTTGTYVEPEFPSMLTLKMIRGDRGALKDMHAVLLSASLAKTLYGNEDPMGRVIRLDNRNNVAVAGVYEDFPTNSSFKDYTFLGAWDLYAATEKMDQTQWDSNSWQIFAELKTGSSFAAASERIKEARTRQGNVPGYHPKFFLHPMSRWHLYAEFKDGKNTGGLITFVWLFGIIGVFVLLLACINFMNLSTARSERRAKEVGIRKAIGSVRRQLVVQFLSESLLVVLLAWILSLVLVEVSLPFFNQLADKKMTVLWLSPLFWLAGIAFSLLTGLVAGSYPALYLSSFRPVKVLKGTFKAGRLASVPRRVLVTLQFTVSVVLIVGTLVVFRQIEFARDLAPGYTRSGLIEMDVNTPELKDSRHIETLRNDLLSSGAVLAFSETSCPITAGYGGTTNISWKGKDPNARPLVYSNQVTTDFGKTIGWQVLQGRDFDRAFLTDSSAMVLNEAAVRLMGLKEPVGETVTYQGNPYTVIGITKDIIRANPFDRIAPAMYTQAGSNVNTMEIRLNQQLGTSLALSKVEAVFKRLNPASPFSYRFVDEEYGNKFGNEQRIGRLAGFFTALAVFISCLGLFGLASFVAEQRTREIGIRKVLGASLANVWGLLSKEFVVLVVVSLLAAVPVSYYLMHRWLENYEKHTGMPWWIFAAAATGALMITMLTVSFQALKAGLANPVRSLRSE
ncbi:MAG TPA: ABC transporter permease [Puia sp.]|jgi:predicted permease